MEEHRKFKNKIMKGGVIFLITMLGLTILSKTIYTLLLPQVTIAKVSQGRIENRVFAVGEIGYDLLTIKNQKVEIKMPVDGSILQCFVGEDQRVKKGEPLFKVQVQEDEKEIAETKYSEAEYSITKKSLERQQGEKLNKKAEVEKEIADQKEQIQQEGKSHKMLEIQQQIKVEEEKMALSEELYLEGFIAESEYKKGQQLLELLKKGEEELQKQEHEEKENKLKTLQKERESLNSALSELQEKQVLEKDKFTCKVDKKKEVIVTSPIDGIIYEKSIAVGGKASKSEVLDVVIPDKVPVTLSFKLGQMQADAIEIEQEVTWTLNNQNSKASVIKKTYDEKSSQTIITCQLPEQVISDLALKCKTYKTADVEVNNNTGEYDLVVPNTALIREGMQTYVYGVQEMQKTFEVSYCVNKIPVTVIKEGDDKSAVTGALHNGQEIIRTTSKPLGDGIEVVIN